MDLSKPRECGITSYVLTSFGLSYLEGDHALYFKREGPNLLLVGVYVDDLLIAGSSHDIVNGLEHALESQFKMKNLGVPKKMLRLEIEIKAGKICMSQQSYLEEILAEYTGTKLKSVQTPIEPRTVLQAKGIGGIESPLLDAVEVKSYRSLVGKLFYLQTCTRPDISCAVSMASRFLQLPRRHH